MIVPPPPPPPILTAAVMAAELLAGAAYSLDAAPPPSSGIGTADCHDALVDVLATGRLPVPRWVEVHCPSDDRVPADKDGYAWVAHDHGSAWVAIRGTHVGDRYLVAHELCHVVYGLTRNDLSEATADECAGNLGFPR